VKIRLAYGKTDLDIELPDGANMEVVESERMAGLPDQADAVRDALRQPIASQPLRELVKASDRVGIVFSDITRPTPNHVILPVLLSELDYVPDEQIILFNSTGTHRPNTNAELRGMLGDEIVDRYRIVQNDASDRDSHVFVGTTANGNHIWIHREFVGCDVRIITGCIEPHFFAGFSGGGKAVLPGLALLETVMRNHSVQNLDSPQACWGITNGNPLWEEMREGAAMVKPTFMLNVTLNRNKLITGVFAGDFEQAHAQGCAFAKEKVMVSVPKPFDIVVTCNSGYPLDLNVYQSVKGMSAAAQVVKQGGSIIIAAACWDGIPDHGEYGKLLREAENLHMLLETIRTQGFQRHDMWQAYIQARICLLADVYLYSHNLSDEQIRGALLKPSHDVGATVSKLLRKYGSKATILVLPEGPLTIPYVKGESSE
jgi:nickel-dependent lactate racemase